MSADEELRALERAALSGGAEDMVAFIRAAMRISEENARMSAEVAKELADMRTARAELEAIKVEALSLARGVVDMTRTAIDGMKAEAMADASHEDFAQEPPCRAIPWDARPLTPEKAQLRNSPGDVYPEVEVKFPHPERLTFRQNELGNGWGGEGWPTADIIPPMAPAPTSQYSPEHELLWRAWTVKHLGGLRRLLMELTKALQDARIVNAPWTSSEPS